MSQPREYSKVDFSKYSKIFQNVNSSWVEAQRAIENEKGVKNADSLANAIQVRHFHNKIICLDIYPLKDKENIERDCRAMGATMKENPCDNCLLITTKVNTEKVARARKLKNVKILRPNFVKECKQL